MHSCFYSGWVRHRRFSPRDNAFRYKVFMVYLDLDELDDVLALSPWWSNRPFRPAQFRREDFHGDPSIPLVDAIKKTVSELTGKTPQGPIRLLANWRYFGYNMNPLCTYYCYAPDGTTLETILAEVTNTPWGESHPYALQCAPGDIKHTFSFNKVFHVSPFNEIAMRYRWNSTTPGDSVLIHIENWQQSASAENLQQVMDATLVLEREAMTSRTMRNILIRYPFMTVKVISAIYWQALKLWCKRVPFVSHPNNRPQHQMIEAKSKGSFR